MASLRIRPNGPIVISGDFAVETEPVPSPASWVTTNHPVIEAIRASSVEDGQTPLRLVDFDPQTSMSTKREQQPFIDLRLRKEQRVGYVLLGVGGGLTPDRLYEFHVMAAVLEFPVATTGDRLMPALKHAVVSTHFTGPVVSRHYALVDGNFRFLRIQMRDIGTLGIGSIDII